MAFNNGFPVGYPQMVYPQQYPYNNMQTAQMPVANQQNQMMTPPTIHAEIVQVDDESAVDRYPLAAGASQMFMTKDEGHVIVKTMYANGQYNKVCYDKREQQQAEAPHYVTWEELENRLAELNPKPKRKREEKENEPV
jgi:hypothetical protein